MCFALPTTCSTAQRFTAAKREGEEKCWPSCVDHRPSMTIHIGERGAFLCLISPQFDLEQLQKLQHLPLPNT